MLLRSLSLTLLLAAAASRTALAVEPAAEPAAATDTVAAPPFTDSTVVTATAIAENRDDVSATVRVVDRREIDARFAESVAELLGTVSGATVATLGPRGQQTSLFLRGANSNQTLVLWNGIPLNDPFSDRFDFAFLSTDGIERLEVVPGPFSALYGSSAMGGVVQVITGTHQGVRLDLAAGQRDYRRAALVTGAERGPLHLDLTGHRRQGRGGTGNDDYDGRELSSRLQWQPQASAEASLVVRWSESETGIPFNSAVASPHRRIAWRERELGLPWSHTSSSWELAGVISQIRYDNALRDPDDPYGFTRGDTDSRADRARAVATRHLADWGWWAAGAEWERDEVTDSSTFGTNLDAERQRTGAAFTQLHLERGRWAADLGVRRDDNDAYGSATSPRLGLVVAATNELRLRASYGESFRAPALIDLFYPVTGNPDLQPERGRTGELALDWRHGAWSLDLAAFDSRQRQLIGFDFITFRSINVGRAGSRGVDGELRYTGSAFELRLGGTHVRARDLELDKPLRNRPEDSAHLVAIGRPGRAVLSLAGNWVGESVNFDPHVFADATNSGHFTVDLAASWQWHEGLAPYARIENALDRRYEAVLGFPAAGRTLIGGVRLAW